MNKNVLSLFCVLAFSAMGWSQTAPLYDDAHPYWRFQWVNNGTVSEMTTQDAYEGTKCLDYNYSIKNYSDMAISRFQESTGDEVVTFTQGRQYKYLQFAVKVSVVNVKKDSICIWCIHCAGGADGFSVKVPFQPTLNWGVISIPTSTLSAGSFLDVVSGFYFNLVGGAVTGHLYIDDIKFTNTDPVATLPPAHRSTNGQAVFLKTQKVKTDTYTLKGILVSSHISNVAANSTNHTSQFAGKELKAGMYAVRQRSLTGAALDNRIFVMGK